MATRLGTPANRLLDTDLSALRDAARRFVTAELGRNSTPAESWNGIVQQGWLEALLEADAPAIRTLCLLSAEADAPPSLCPWRKAWPRPLPPVTGRASRLWRTLRVRRRALRSPSRSTASRIGGGRIHSGCIALRSAVHRDRHQARTRCAAPGTSGTSSIYRSRGRFWPSARTSSASPGVRCRAKV